MYQFLSADSRTESDNAGRIRLDDLEVAPEVQAAVADLWPKLTTENLAALTDFSGYQRDLLQLLGFGLDAVGDETNVDPTKVLTETTFTGAV